MNEPRRLIRSGGASQQLLATASLDIPSADSLRRAALLASTASSFASSSAAAAPAPRRSMTKTLATWAFIGAAASVTLAAVASRLWAPSGAASQQSASPALAELPQAPSASPARASDIVAEPTSVSPAPPTPVAPPALVAPVAPPALVDAPTPFEPWVPSFASQDRGASAAETRELEAARLAVGRGDDLVALGLLDRFELAHPSSPFQAEQQLLRIQALADSGKSPEARRLADAFLTQHPTHPSAARLKTVGK